MIEGSDLDAKTTLELLVLDEHDKPVSGADISVHAMHSQSAGSWSYADNPPRARTDIHGRARIEHWVWVDVDARMIALHLIVSHPDFTPFRDPSFATGPGEHRVRLERATRVTVRAWSGSPQHAMGELFLQLEAEANVTAADWKTVDDRMVTTRIAPGRHTLLVASTSEGRVWYSDFVDFTVVAGNTHDLSVELRPSESLTGRLDADVPRPVQNGHVLLVVDNAQATRDRPRIQRRFETDVRPDGSFSFERLPRGTAHLFVLASGWVSHSPSADRLGVEAGLPDWMRGRATVLQQITVPATSALLVPMQPTGAIEIVVRDEQGRPVEDVTVIVASGLVLPDASSIATPWRLWYAQTDGHGLARIEDVPPCTAQGIGTIDNAWKLTADERRRCPHVDVRPGETVRAELIVRPAGRTRR